MNRTQIEWVKNPDGTQGFTWNPLTGCLNHVNGMCKGGGFPCYAYRLANGRLRTRYLANDNVPCHPAMKIQYLDDLPPAHKSDPFLPRFWESRLEQPLFEHNARGIFTCDMGELFGDWIPEQWQTWIFNVIKARPQHRFYLLTKQPQNLIKWSPFPDNCWVGVTVTSGKFAGQAWDYLSRIKAKVKYISFEPLLGAIERRQLLDLLGVIDWLIIGGCTGTQNDLSGLRKKYPHLHLIPYGKKWVLSPPIEHVEELVRAADKAGIPVFLKNNLKPLLETLDITGTDFGRLTSLVVKEIKDVQGLSRQRGWYGLRQELPEKGEL